MDVAPIVTSGLYGHSAVVTVNEPDNGFISLSSKQSHRIDLAINDRKNNAVRVFKAGEDISGECCQRSAFVFFNQSGGHHVILLMDAEEDDLFNKGGIGKIYKSYELEKSQLGLWSAKDGAENFRLMKLQKATRVSLCEGAYFWLEQQGSGDVPKLLI